MLNYYKQALTNLSNSTIGHSKFEEISRELANLIYTDYTFIPPSGGKGSKDSGRDGFCYARDTVLACSLRKDYKTKIREDVEKNKHHKQMLFFTNQIIDEIEKNDISNQYDNIIKLIIYSRDDIANEINYYDKKIEANEKIHTIHMLLDTDTGLRPYVISFFNLQTIQNENAPEVIFNSELLIHDKYNKDKSIISSNPIFDLICFLAKKDKNIPNIFVKGIFHVGKTFLMTDTYNKVLEHKKDFYLPIPIFTRLRYLEHFELPDISRFPESKFLILLDGLDELSEESKSKLSTLVEYYSSFDNISFIISGRNASFTSDLFSQQNNSNTNIIHSELKTYVEDEEMLNISKAHNSKGIQNIIVLPPFRILFRNGEKLDFSNIYEKLLIAEIKNDINKTNNAHAKTLLTSDLNTETITNEIFPKLSEMCHHAYLEKSNSFTLEQIRKTINNSIHIEFLVNSTLMSLKDGKYFISETFYYEFFLALYYSTHKKDFTELLLKNKTLSLKNINIYCILLSICRDNDTFNKKIYKRFKKDKYFYKIATTSDYLSVYEKQKLYFDIIENHNRENTYIGSTTLYKEFAFSTDDLPTYLSTLLEEDESLSSAFNFHLNIISQYLEHTNKECDVKFHNSLILLGPWHKSIWTKEQQELLRDKTPSLIRLLMGQRNLNKLNTEKIILNWYKTNRWTTNWGKEDWEKLIQEIICTQSDLYDIDTEEEFRLKIRLFNQFDNDEHIRKLALPLCEYIIRNIKETLSSSYSCPLKADDSFNPTPERTDDDYFTFTFKLGLNIYLDSNELVLLFHKLFSNIDILKTFSISNLSSLFSVFEDYWAKTITSLRDESLHLLFNVISIVSKEANLELLQLIGNMLKLLTTKQKRILFGYVIGLSDNQLRRIILFSQTLYALTDIEDVDEAKTLLLKIQDRPIIKDYIRLIDKNHLLYNYTRNLEDMLFDDGLTNSEIKEEQKRIMQGFDHLNENLSSVVLNKEKMIKALSQIKKWSDSKPESKKHIALYSLKKETVLSNVIQIMTNEIDRPPFCYQFFVEYLLKNKNMNYEDLYQKINRAFDDDYYFWKFFLDLFSTDEELTNYGKLLFNDERVKDKVLLSLEQELKNKHKTLSLNEITHAESIPEWLPIFIKSIRTIFDNRMPGWFDRTVAIKLIAYTMISYSYGYHRIKYWPTYNVFEWLNDVADIPIQSSIQWAIDNYSAIDNNQSKGQILNYFIENYDQMDAEIRKWVNETIFNETRRELTLDHKAGTSELNRILAVYWEKNTNPNLLNNLLNYIPVGKYKQFHNQCRDAIFSNIFRIANEDQKKTLIQIVLCADFPKKERLLMELGHPASVIKGIKRFLKGEEVETDYLIKDRMFGSIGPNKPLLQKYMRLMEYSKSRYTYRRAILCKVARQGIKDSINEDGYRLFKYWIKKKIRKYRKLQMHYDLIGLKNEVEQIVFEKSTSYIFNEN